MYRIAIILLLVLTLIANIPTIIAAEKLKSTYTNREIMATFNKDGTILVEGKVKEVLGGDININIYGPLALKLIKSYPIKTNSEGYFKLLTEPYEVDIVNIYVQVPGISYGLVLKKEGAPEVAYEAGIYELQPGDKELEKNSISNFLKLKQKWFEYSPKFNEDNPYEIAPSFTAPYKGGRLKQQVLIDALNMTKFARYVAGLSENILLDESLTESAHNKVIVLEKTFNPNDPHHPLKPDDMDQNFFDITTTKICQCAENLAYRVMASEGVAIMMDDAGSSNFNNVGHRSGILEPNLKIVGFGNTSKYVAMHLDYDYDNKENVNYVAWPPPGEFPTFFLERGPFSIEFNNNIYQDIDANFLKITVVSKTQKKKWVIQPTENSFISEAGELFVNNSRSLGNNHSAFLVFQPNGFELNAGDEIDINITGIKYINGEDASIKYTINPFNMNDILVIVDGKEKKFERSPSMLDGTTMLPLRETFDLLGADVYFNNKTREIIAKKDNQTIKLKLNSTTAQVNGKTVNLSVPAKIIDGKTMVPLRFVGEALGIEVKWDADLKVIHLNTKQ